MNRATAPSFRIVGLPLEPYHPSRVVQSHAHNAKPGCFSCRIERTLR